MGIVQHRHRGFKYINCQQNMHLHWLDPQDPFPPITQAFREPNGLLAAGADLSPVRLLDAYQRGIFPWYSAGEPILWWSPAPRCVIYPEKFHTSRSLQKLVRSKIFTVTSNRAFADVMQACATVDNRQYGTWITQDMLDAYCAMHELGWAHSIEVWQEDELVGGVYGLAIGKIFFGESMFSYATDASKIALLFLCRALVALDLKLLDCQVENPHLMSLGAQNISGQRFQSTLKENVYPATALSCADLEKTLEQLQV
jgi:leucyl/phenylalanyl-tRNA--protein transferase